MGESLSLQFLLLLGTTHLCVMGTFYTESDYNSHDVFGDDVTINVISEIPGDIKWITTNEKQVSVAVKVSAPSFDVLNSTRVSFYSETSFVSLEIRRSIKKEVAAAHSTGSRIATWAGRIHFVTLLLPMTLFVSTDRRFIHAFLLALVLLQICVTASFPVEDPDHKVNITIRAPRHFRYKSINLAINNGTIRVTEETYKYAEDVHCSTTLNTKGCEGCCHGNGVCFNNTCFCEENYDPSTNCKNIKKREIFFINTLDPRIEKKILPNGLVMDLSAADNSRDTKTRGKNQNHIKLRVRDMAATSNDGMFHFNENGLLKRARHGKVSFVLRKRKDSNCFIDLVLKKFGIRLKNFTIDLCNNSSESEIRDKHRSNFNFTESLFNVTTKSILDLNEHAPRRHDKFREIPIKFERCGYESQNDVSIYFKVHDNVEKDELKKFYKDDIYLHTVYRKDRHYLKIPSRNVSEKEIQRKCQRSRILRNNICRQDHVTFYKFVCDSIITQDTIVSDDETNNSINISEAVYACNFLLEILQAYCPSISLIEKYPLTSQSRCLLRYTGTVDLFAREYLSLNPTIILQNGESVQKENVIIPILNVSRTTRTEIILKEDLPEFKILKIAVIPNDPVPGDIYKVRLDYACATNETVIEMSVTGSDKYNSHVTCRVPNNCDCCSVHAAGAADAVIDYVSINITDHLANTDLHKEMVVIF